MWLVLQFMGCPWTKPKFLSLLLCSHWVSPTLSPVIRARVPLSSRAMRWSRAEKRRPSETHTASPTPWPLLVGYFLCWAIMSHCTADKTELQGPQSHSPSTIFPSWKSCLTRPQEVPWTNLLKLSKLRICVGPPTWTSRSPLLVSPSCHF